MAFTFAVNPAQPHLVELGTCAPASSLSRCSIPSSAHYHGRVLQSSMFTVKLRCASALFALASSYHPRGWWRQKRKRTRSRSMALRSSVDDSIADHAEFPVYIEDTDCFGVVFYANYFKYFQRAAAAAKGGKLSRRLSLVGATGVRYASPARLGDTVLVATEPQVAVQSRGQFVSLTQAAKVGEAVCVSAELMYADLDQMEEPQALPIAAPALLSGGREVLVLPVTPHLDELTGAPPRWLPPGSQCLGALDALRWFERARTTCIGGAAGLEALQAAGTLVVVARLEDFRLDVDAAAVASEQGHLLEARTAVSLLGRGRRVVFEQQVVDATKGQALAWGTVTCVCVDAKTQRLVALPQELKASIAQHVELSAASAAL